MREESREPKQNREAALADLAVRQHGVVAARQLAALGFSSSAVGRAAELGRLQRVHRGVYAVGHRRSDWRSRCMTAVLAGAPAVASHFAAAWIWGLLRTAPETIHLTTPSGRRRMQGFVAHRARLNAADITERENIPLTALGRTYLDLAALAPDRVGRFLERGEELQIFDLRATEAALDRATGHPGRGPLRRALAVYREEPAFVRSRTEGRFLDMVLSAGLPRPATNFFIGELELDVYWERERFGVEIDTFETHGTRAAFERDRRREDDLQLAGVETIRITGVRMRSEPQAVVTRVAAHLARRRRELG